MTPEFLEEIKKKGQECFMSILIDVELALSRESLVLEVGCAAIPFLNMLGSFNTCFLTGSCDSRDSEISLT